MTTICTCILIAVQVASPCRRLLLLLLLAVAIMPSAPAFSDQSTYEQPVAFVNRQFEGQPPQPSVLYPDAALKQQIKSVLGHRYSSFRIRYWARDDRTVWILQEIGKEKYITAGFAIVAGSIGEFKVLIFRESRGWEVRYDSFAQQFKGLRLTQDLDLDGDIDNVTGATLSVRAVTKLAKLALLLHHTVHS